MNRKCWKLESHKPLDINKYQTLLEIEGVKDLPGVSIIGPEDASKRGGICSLLLDDKLPSHDIALLLDEVSGVMVRSGQHCVHSWFNDKGYNGSLRASAYFYNTEEDVRRFVDTFSEAIHAFS